MDVSRKVLGILTVVVAVVAGFAVLLHGVGVNFTSTTGTVIVQTTTLTIQTSAVTVQSTQPTLVVMRTVSEFAGYGPTTVPVPAGQYIYIEYWAYADSSFGTTRPRDSDDVWLEVGITIENHGYNRVPMGWSNFVAGMNRDNQIYQYNVDSITTYDSSPLPTNDLANGFTTWGYLVFEVPACCGFDLTNYHIAYQPASGTYNVQYVNLGIQIRT